MSIDAKALKLFASIDLYFIFPGFYLQLNLSRISDDQYHFHSSQFRVEVIKMGKNEEICGEPNPGFSLWTTAHGFHHYRFNLKHLKAGSVMPVRT